jgi:hypothetical protein
MQNKRRLVGAAAGSAVAIATLLGTPVVNAQDCVICGDPDHGPPVFDKAPSRGVPEHAFIKIDAPEEAFGKIPGGEGNPGRTESVFGKHNP